MTEAVGVCVGAALQQAVTQLRQEQQGHIAQMDTLKRENGRLKEVQEQGAATGEGLEYRV